MSGDLELLVQGKGGGSLSSPPVEGEIKWETERRGVPGKLTFTIADTGGLTLEEGAAVRMRWKGQNVFYGFLFSQKRSKDLLVSCTAYDQLRYLKNKDTYVYIGKSASELIAMLAADFHLQTGSLEDTGFKIAQRVEDNKTLFDIIYNALDLTLQNTGKLFVLYDDFGKITLKNIESMKLDTLIGPETAENYDYQSSIDGDTYDQIKLVFSNQKTGKRDVYLTKDTGNINKWGVLQYFDTLDEKENGQAKADALLKLYNQAAKSLTVKGAFGDIRARAGASVPVMLDLGGGTKISNYMVVEKARHSFENGLHQMDLTLRGGGFNA